MSSPAPSSKEDLPTSSPRTLSSSGKGKVSKIAPSRDAMPTFESFGLVPAEGVYELASDADALSLAYGKPTLRAITSNGLVVGCSVAATIGGLLFGFDQGLVSIILVMKQFLAVFPEIDSTISSRAGFMKGLLTALLELGALIGAIVAGFSSDRISRKRTLGLGICIFVIGSVIQTASYHYPTLVIGRFIGGIGVGVLSTTAPTYISEVAPPHLRGTLLVAEQIAIVTGIVVMYYVTYGTRFIESQWSFRLPFLLQMIPGFVLFGLLFIMPFSPRWLAQQGRDEECLDTLCRLRKLPRTDVRVQAEWLSIRSEAVYVREVVLERHPKLQGEGFVTAVKLEFAAWFDCFRPGVARRSWIGIGLMFFQQFVGINALIYYSPTLLATLGFDYETQLNMSGLLNITQLAACLTALYTLDRFGRKWPLLIGGIAMTLWHAITAIMIGLYQHDWPSYPGQAKVGLSMLFLFMFSFGIGWGPVPWALPSEIHSTSTRAKGVALSVASNWLNNFIIGLVVPPFIERSAVGTFVFFAAWSLLSVLFTILLVPETKGRSLEDMDALFHSNLATKDAREKALILGQLTGHETSNVLAARHDDKRENKGTERRFEYA